MKFQWSRASETAFSTDAFFEAIFLALPAPLIFRDACPMPLWFFRSHKSHRFWVGKKYHICPTAAVLPVSHFKLQFVFSLTNSNVRLMHTLILILQILAISWCAAFRPGSTLAIQSRCLTPTTHAGNGSQRWTSRHPSDRPNDRTLCDIR